MFCPNCGAEIPNNSNFCPNCNAELVLNNDGYNASESYTNQIPQYNPIIEKGKKAKTYGIVSIVTGFFFPLLSWIFGGMGISYANEAYKLLQDEQFKKNKKLCVIGIIISLIVWISTVCIKIVSNSHSAYIY